VAQYLSESVHVYYTVDTTDDSVFAEEVAVAALRAHDRVLEHRERNPALGRAATTLTLWIGVWPRIYLVQLGDSRYYVLKGDELVQISRDQTVAQDLMDQGVLTPEQASRGRWSHTLSNAIGGVESNPVVTAIENDWKYVHLLCSDGLTKHVSNDQIKQRLQAMTSAQQACEALLQDALDGGGTDNITVVVGRAHEGV
jgi:protein phosphatase